MLAGLGLFLALAGPPAPLPSDALHLRTLEEDTGLDLDRVWTEYLRERRHDDTFYGFARRKYRRRLGAGIGLSLAGLGLTGAGIAMVLVAAGNDNDIDVIGGALVVTLGFGLAVPGAILWPTSQIRLHKLKRARPAPLAALRLRGAGPIPLRRGAGLGLSLAF